MKTRPLGQECTKQCSLLESCFHLAVSLSRHVTRGISKLTSLTDKMFELVHFNESDAVGLLATANCRDSFPTPRCGVYVYTVPESCVGKTWFNISFTVFIYIIQCTTIKPFLAKHAYSTVVLMGPQKYKFEGK
jgi:hypothetical protein